MIRDTWSVDRLNNFPNLRWNVILYWKNTPHLKEFRLVNTFRYLDPNTVFVTTAVRSWPLYTPHTISCSTRHTCFSLVPRGVFACSIPLGIAHTWLYGSYCTVFLKNRHSVQQKKFTVLYERCIKLKVLPEIFRQCAIF